MHAGKIIQDTTKRGLIRTFRFPILLVQDFRGRTDQGITNYLCDCDTFHAGVVKDRAAWLKASHFKYDMRYETHQQWEDLVVPKVFRLYVEFARPEEAALYRVRWCVDKEGRS